MGLVHDLAHRAEALDGVAAHEAVDLDQLFVGKAEIGFAHRHKLIAGRACGPDPEGVIGIEGRALAMTALGIHQHGIDQQRVALPLPPQALGTTGNVGRVAALEHDAFDGLGIEAARIGARCRKLVPACERDQRREVDAWVLEPRHERFEPGAPRCKRLLAQIIGAVAEQIVGAQMRRKFLQQARVHGFAVEPLLQHVEGLHAPIAQDQQLAVDCAVEVERLGQIGKGARNVLAGTRIEPRNVLAVPFACDRLHANTVPFPFGGELRGIECGQVLFLDRMA